MECPACGLDVQNNPIVSKLKDERYTSTPNTTFEISQCTSCGLARTIPIPKNIDSFYPDTYYKSRIKYNRDGLSKFVDIFDQVYEGILGIDDLLPEDIENLLVVGCGPGHKLPGYESLGYNVTGIEPSRASVDFGISNYNTKIIHGTLTDSSSLAELEYYDAVIFDHVFEHIANPNENLDVVNDILRKNGYLIIEVPNFNSPSRALFREFWGDYDVPRHLFHYTPDTLRKLVTSNGFNLDRESYDKSARLHAHWFAKLLSVKYHIPNHGRMWYPLFTPYGILAGAMNKTRFRHRYVKSKN